MKSLIITLGSIISIIMLLLLVDSSNLPLGLEIALSVTFFFTFIYYGLMIMQGLDLKSIGKVYKGNVLIIKAIGLIVIYFIVFTVIMYI